VRHSTLQKHRHLSLRVTVEVSRFLSHTACLESRLSPGEETVAGMTATTLGYARISTTRQDLHTQRDTLAAAGVEADRIFTDTLSGAAGTDRPGLTALLDYARAGTPSLSPPSTGWGVRWPR
jgi:hypothetical protein